jgi:CRP/FNR family transcriptional regulator, cyclic AMP receptor protein
VRLRKNQKLELIGSVPLFAGCSKKDVAAIATIADEIDIPAGTVIVKEGERGREFFVIVEGSTRVTRKGRKVADLGAGDIVGEMALVSDLPRNSTVTAATDLRLLVVIDRDFRRLLRDVPSIALSVLDTMARRTAENTKLGLS